jgi:hypothetical protein
MGDIETLYQNLLAQNISLENTIEEQKNIYSIDSQKINYQSRQTSFILWMNKYFLYFYGLLLLLVIYKLYLKNEWNKYFRVFIFLLFVIYPFVIGFIETWIAFIFNYFYALLNVNVYTTPKWI